MIMTSKNLIFWLQCWHLIPALNVWAPQAKSTTAHLIACQCPGHGCDHMSLASQLNIALIPKLYGSVIDVLGLFFWHVIQVCFYNQAPADVRSTGAEIKCLHRILINLSLRYVCVITESHTINVYFIHLKFQAFQILKIYKQTCCDQQNNQRDDKEKCCIII